MFTIMKTWCTPTNFCTDTVNTPLFTASKGEASNYYYPSQSPNLLYFRTFYELCSLIFPCRAGGPRHNDDCIITVNCGDLLAPSPYGTCMEGKREASTIKGNWYLAHFRADIFYTFISTWALLISFQLPVVSRKGYKKICSSIFGHGDTICQLTYLTTGI